MSRRFDLELETTMEWIETCIVMVTMLCTRCDDGWLQPLMRGSKQNNFSCPHCGNPQFVKRLKT